MSPDLSGGAPQTTRILGYGFVASLLVIAFLLGRESSKVESPSPPAGAAAVVPNVAEADRRLPWEAVETTRRVEPSRSRSTFERSRSASESGTADHFGDLGHGDSDLRAADRETRDGLWIDPQSLHPGALTKIRQTPQRQSTADYFAEVDAIRSAVEGVEPRDFAMQVLQAGIIGSTEGLERLAKDAARMEQDLNAIAPPTEVVGFHASSIATLAETRAVLENLQEAMAKRDLELLSDIAGRAEKLQHRVRALQQHETALRTE